MYYEKDTALRSSEILMTKKNQQKPTKDINSDDAKKQ